ncbi:MAG: glutamine-hydrolyzing carbamoyl-phosphate synthase small subunit, partial [Acidobacteriota bacterium]
GVPGNSKDKSGIPANFESDRIHAKALVVSEYSAEHNHWNSEKSLGEWLEEEKIPGIFGIDTRALTRKIREKGAMLGKIITDNDPGFYDPNRENLVKSVSRKKPLKLGKGVFKIIAIDCGMKFNIARQLLKRDVSLKIVPWDYDFASEDYDGLFISNGPGDPVMCSKTIKNIRTAIESKKPIFGICLGNQLLALASGAKTYKLKYGHRGQNQPCVCGRKGYITSQNHGYAVDKKTLPKGWRELFSNANDFTNEGIIHEKLPFFSVQFHPEGSCGPRDTDYLFDDFVKLMGKARR